MNNRPIDLLLVTVPSLGECTLLSHLEELPTKVRTYDCLNEVAKIFNLKELPQLTHGHIQEIFNVLAYVFSDYQNTEEREIRVMLSGTHLSYPFIQMDLLEQTLKECVTSMVLYFWNKPRTLGTTTPFTKHFEKMLDETPVEEAQKNEDGEVIYCLFLGIPQQ